MITRRSHLHLQCR